MIHPPRRVPEALREPLKRELDALIKQGIIAKVDESTDWVNSLVCVTKRNGKLRICLDPKDFNCAIKRPHHCNIRSCTSKVEQSQIFLHRRCQRRVLEYQTWSRQVLLHSLQFASIPASPLWPDLCPGHFSKEGRWDLQWPPWFNWHRRWHCHLWKRPCWPRCQP